MKLHYTVFVFFVALFFLLSSCSLEDSAYSHLNKQQLIANTQPTTNATVYEQLQNMGYSLPTHPCHDQAKVIGSYERQLNKAIMTQNSTFCQEIAERTIVSVQCTDNSTHIVFNKTQCLEQTSD